MDGAAALKIVQDEMKKFEDKMHSAWKLTKSRRATGEQDEDQRGHHQGHGGNGKRVGERHVG